jgi:hypothetical protein
MNWQECYTAGKIKGYYKTYKNGSTSKSTYNQFRSTFGHLPYLQCWDEGVKEEYDIAVIGAPYDIGVTFRTDARFGPSSIREGSKRIKVKKKKFKKHIILIINNMFLFTFRDTIINDIVIHSSLGQKQ